MFKPLQYDSGKLVDLKYAVNQTITKGMALIVTSGYLTEATTGSEDILYVAMEDVTTSDSEHTEGSVIMVDGVRFEVTSDEAVAQAYCGTRCDLATSSTINHDAVTEKVFLIERLKGTTAVTKTVQGYFKRFTAS